MLMTAVRGWRTITLPRRCVRPSTEEPDMPASRPARSVAAALVVAAGLSLGACSKNEPSVATSELSSNGAVPSTTAATPTTREVTPAGTTPATTAPKGTTSTTAKATTTTKAKTEGAAFAAEVLAAFKDKLGDYKALQITVHVDAARNGQVQYQKPTKPTDVDALEYVNGELDGPIPVTLTGGGKLEDNLFDVNEVAWDKLPDLFDRAVKEMGPIDGSTGVTHIIVQKDLPFSDKTVIRIYIDGGSRSLGGYVSFLADGTLQKVSK